MEKLSDIQFLFVSLFRTKSVFHRPDSFSRLSMRKIIAFILWVCVFTSCDWRMKPAERNKEISVKVERYDRLQFEYVTMNSVFAWQKMNTEYPQATKLLMEDVLNLGEVSDVRIADKLLSYFSDTTLLRLMNDAEHKYQDVEWIEKRLNKGFSYLKSKLPDLVVPRFYAQVSALNQSVVVGDSLVGFSLDKYMGADYPLYKKYYYEEQSRLMDPERIVPDCFLFYLISQYPMPFGPGRTLLDVLMHRGKINWLITKALEYDSVEDELGYDADEKKWCKKNKSALWKFMLDRNHLNATDPMVIRSYLSNTYVPLFDKEVPFGVGTWMGYQLIAEYMRTHKDVTIQQLMERTDYWEMLLNTSVTF